MSKKIKKTITTEKFDAKFDAGEDIADHLDADKAMKKVNVDFPLWMVRALDQEAERLQIPRQAVIKMWIDEKLRKIANQTKGQAVS